MNFTKGQGEFRAAFTVTELMVSVAIVGLLVAVTLPAVQHSRETARRIECLSNLRQLGVALHNFETSHRQFPVNGGPLIRSSGNLMQFSVQAQLLSHLDQRDVYDSIDFKQLNSPAFQRPAKFDTRIRVFQCPSDNTDGGTACNYRVCTGSSPFATAPNRTSREAELGVFAIGSDCSSSRIRDGMSQTVAISERRLSSVAYAPYDADVDYWYSGARGAMGYPSYLMISSDAMSSLCTSLSQAPSQYFSRSGRRWDSIIFEDTGYNHVAVPNSRNDCSVDGAVPSSGLIESDGGQHSASSYHGAGVNVLYADGRCIFLSSHVDRRVWRAMATSEGSDEVD